MSLLPARLAALPRAVLLLAIADLSAIVSIGVGSVTINWWIVTHGNAAELALFNVGAAVLMLLALPLLSTFADRHPKARMMAVGTLLAMLAAVALCLLSLSGHYHIAALGALYALDVIGFALVIPASSALAAELVPPAQLGEALAIQKSGQSLGRLGGYLLGGVLVAALGITASLACWAALVAFAAGIALCLPAQPRSEVAPKHWLAEARAGLVAKWRIPVERWWSLYAMSQMMLLIPALATLLPLQVRALGLDARTLGLAEAALGGGMLLSTLWLAQPLARRLGRLRASVLAMLGCSAGVAITGASQAGWSVVAAFALLGGCMAVTQLIGQTHRMLAVPADYRARFIAVNMMITNISAALGQSLAGLLLAAYAVGQVYLLAAAGMLLLALAFPLLPGIRHLLALRHEEVSGLYQRDYPQAFANGKHTTTLATAAP